MQIGFNIFASWQRRPKISRINLRIHRGINNICLAKYFFKMEFCLVLPVQLTQVRVAMMVLFKCLTNEVTVF